MSREEVDEQEDVCLICRDGDSAELGPVHLMHCAIRGCSCSENRFHIECFRDWVDLKRAFVCPICGKGETADSQIVSIDIAEFFWQFERTGNVFIGVTSLLMFLLDIPQTLTTLCMVLASLVLYVLVRTHVLGRFMFPDRRNAWSWLFPVFVVVLIMPACLVLGIVFTFEDLMSAIARHK